MTDKRIEPALSPEEWREWTDDDSDAFAGIEHAMAYFMALRGKPAAIAILNDALEDSDPRKITRENVPLLRLAMSVMRHSAPPADVETSRAMTRASQLVEALSSYLPPEDGR